MTRHLLRLIWNRRRTNLLVTIEIFISFLVLFGVTTLAVFYLHNYRLPLGFAYEDVLVVGVSTHGQRDEEPISAPRAQEEQETFRHVMLAARDFPEVVAVAGATNHPYSHSTWESGEDVNGVTYRFQLTHATDGFDKVFDLELARGRWFDRSDDGASYDPVVITRSLSRSVFGDKDPIGRSLPREKLRDGTIPRERRVIGEVPAYRDKGELTSPVNHLFQRLRLDDPEGRIPAVLVLELRPGTTAAFEEVLMKRFQGIAKDWSFEPRPLVEHRAEVLQTTFAPLVAVGVIAVFLMLMVAMGLTGVLWQTVTQRTREVGLRRAKGATARRIHRQVLGELALMTSIALLVGVAIVVQFPLLDLLGWVPPGVFAASLALSVAAIYLLTMACGWYPSRMATRIQPAEALHYE
jgi:putative ABC transport system permease protein